MRYNRIRYFVVLGIVTCLVAAGLMRYGSVTNLVAVLNGQRVVLERSAIDLGDIDAEAEEFEVGVVNLSSNEVTLVGVLVT